jgi:aminoglycoside phosphotransferase (APT) family kinase protein
MPRTDGHLLPAAVRDAAPTLNERILRLIDDLDTGPLTITHSDYRLDNMFFGLPGADYKLAVFDWQIANRGGASFDVAYFISGSLEVEDRRRYEMDLLRAYHDALLARGVRDYSRDDLVLDYRRIMILMLANTIGGVASLNTTNERGVMLFELLFRRVSAAVSDLDSLELLLDA